MNCKEFSKHIGDYVNRRLDLDVFRDAEVHLSSCSDCAGMVSELEQTSLMVQSLERKPAPIGFEERLKARMSVERTAITSKPVVQRWIEALRNAILGAPSFGHRSIRPALAGFLLCAVITGSLLMLNTRTEKIAPDTDWSYIQTCQEQHNSFAAANPLGDESAVVLRARASDQDL